MFDLKFSLPLPCGGFVTKEFNTIMDFTDEVEEGIYTQPFLSSGEVTATFFENPLLDQQFKTVKDLYHHCVNIMGGHH